MELPRTPSFRLDGRHALVTGASSGIGLGCAVALAESGAHVTLMARQPDRLNATCKEMADAGLSVGALVGDIRDVDEMAAKVESLRPLDVFVNSAGLAIHTPATDTQADDFDRVMDVNLRGAYFASQAVAKAMLADGRAGSIINISSQMAVVGGQDRAVYAASKHAVEGFTKSMAIELGRDGIRINTICPTFVRTPLTEQTFSRPERVKWIEEKIKLGRVGEVSDIMGAVQFLASDAAALITGSALIIDGGWTAD